MGSYNGDNNNNYKAAHKEWAFWPFVEEWYPWTMYGRGGNDMLIGGPRNDSISGGTGNDVVYGYEGDDLLYGWRDDDLLYGGIGNDAIYGESGSDRIFGEEGNDYIDGGFGNDFLYGGNGDDQIDGNEGSDYISGGNNNDLIFGSSGGDFLYGNSGNDIIYGEGTWCNISGRREDVIGGNNGDVGVVTYALCAFPPEDVDDYLYGGSGDDKLLGEWGNDSLFGGSGSDNLDGGEGNDYLSGYGYSSESQIDELTGRGGADQFVLGDRFGNIFYRQLGHAVINDFNRNEGDKIQVYGSLTNYTLTPWRAWGANATLIQYQGELIGIVANTSSINFSDFTVV